VSRGGRGKEGPHHHGARMRSRVQPAHRTAGCSVVASAP
jgi:hypothetical protein